MFRGLTFLGHSVSLTVSGINDQRFYSYWKSGLVNSFTNIHSKLFSMFTDRKTRQKTEVKNHGKRNACLLRRVLLLM